MNDEDMDTFVFAVGTRKALVRLQKEMQDLVRPVAGMQMCVDTASFFFLNESTQPPSMMMNVT